MSGLRRRIEEWEPSREETGQIPLQTDEEKQRLAEDVFYQLEHQTDDANKLKKAAPYLVQLQVTAWTYVGSANIIIRVSLKGRQRSALE